MLNFLGTDSSLAAKPREAGWVPHDHSILGVFSENWEPGILRTLFSEAVRITEGRKAFCPGAKEQQIAAHHAAFMAPFRWLILPPKRFSEHQVPVNTDNWGQLILNSPTALSSQASSSESPSHLSLHVLGKCYPPRTFVTTSSLP